MKNENNVLNVENTSTSIKSEIEEEVKETGKRLLDLTFRNRLLDYQPKPSSRRTIQVVDEIPKEIFDILVLQKKTMQFKPSKISQEEIPLLFEEEDLEEFSLLSNLQNTEASEHHTDRLLQTRFTKEELSRRLRYVHQQAEEIFREQGYSVLYLALGFLEWTEESEHANQLNRAPLILIPVKLTPHKKARTRFSLSWSGAEIFPNISLEVKLKAQVELPDLGMFEEKTDVDDYFQDVTDAVSHQDNWRVVPDIYLDFFSFTKFVMYKDLGSKKWTIGTHPLLAAVLGKSPQPLGNGEFRPEEVDQVPSSDFYHVMDADSSQIAVIEEVKKGRNLVVEGPPGTGKSQTIANIIAELLADGKKVLFVSEKMAALEVVKERLDSVGLGDFCLELHSHKSNRQEVLQELERTFFANFPQKETQNQKFDGVDLHKASLNSYVNALHEPISQTQKSPFTLFGIRETAQCHFEKVKRDMPRIMFANPTETTLDCWTTAKQRLEALATMLPLVTPVTENPWRGCKPNIVTPAYVEDTKALIGTCINTLDVLEKAIHDLAAVCALHIPTMLKTLPQTFIGVSVVSKAIPVEREVLLNDAWNRPNSEADTLIKKVGDVQKSIVETHAKFNTDQLINTLEASRVLEKTIRDIEEICGIQPINTPEGFQSMLNAADVMEKSIPVEQEVLRNEAWNKPNLEAEKLINQVESVQKVLADVMKIFTPAALAQEIDSLRDEYTDLCGIFPLFRFFHRRYNSIKKEIRSFYKDKPPRKIEEILASLGELARCIKMQKKIQALEQTGRSLFGSYWKAEEIDPDQLRQFAKWVVLFRKEFLNGTLTDRAIDVVSEGVDSVHLNKLIAHAKTQHEDLVTQRETLISQLEIDPKTVFGLDAENVSFTDFSSRLEMWQKELPLFDKWIQFVYNDVGELSKKPEQLIADLAKLSQCTEIRAEIQDMEQTGQDLFGRYWHGEDSKLKRLNEFADWIVHFRKQLIGGILTEQAIDLVSVGVDQEEIECLIKQVKVAENDFKQQCDVLFDHLGTDTNILFGVETEKVSFTEIRSRFELWEQGLTRLQAWESYVRSRELAQQTIAQPLINRIEDDMLEPEDIVSCFEGNLADALLYKAFRERPELRDFVFNLHEKNIVDFRELDCEIINLNRQRLITQLHENRPRPFVGASDKSEIGTLQDQFGRKKGRKALRIRGLLSEVGGLIQRIKPCFMMSPLSIAQFCEPQMVRFDVVVFDEASQIKPEDALGALLRAEQAVVLGDTQQLPPTRFFDKVVEDIEEDEDDNVNTSIVDVESILHQCRVSFSVKQLKWHYRSRHESLIVFSNQKFYDNRMLIFPSAIDKAEHLGLKFKHIPDAVYDQGKSATNRKEAQAVVKMAFEHYRNYPNKSLGIGAFSVKQQQAILDEFEVQLQQQPEMEEFFASSRKERFFVKNLETIQGDERDVIFISVGYGFNKEGKLYKRFGPLIHDGGERRLNVLITRAREKCVVFSNFRASDLQLDAGASVGANALKAFLNYAETGNLPPDESADGNFESPFEESVYEFLRSEGYTVKKQVGCAGYRIDLAVVNPTAPGSYLIGIECDGAPYHSSPVARDRDRLRQQQLERLGWKLHRIWSTDWYRNRAETRRRLLDTVERAKAEKMSSVPIPEPIDPPKPSEPDLSSESNLNPLKPISFADHIHDYQTCKDLKIPMRGELHQQTTSQLAKAVTEVVKIESPIHTDLVALRIRQLWGLKRAGERIKNAIKYGIADAHGKKLIYKNGDFLWATNNREIKVRSRTKPKIEWICEAEIVEAMKLVLTLQGAITPNALIRETTKLFGYKSINKAIIQQINPLLEKFIQKGIFQLAANEMVNLPEDIS